MRCFERGNLSRRQCGDLGGAQAFDLVDCQTRNRTCIEGGDPIRGKLCDCFGAEARHGFDGNRRDVGGGECRYVICAEGRELHRAQHPDLCRRKGFGLIRAQDRDLVGCQACNGACAQGRDLIRGQTCNHFRAQARHGSVRDRGHISG
ncbi:hypothetical protein D3C72_667420 [compost metagenome]